jgi:hypothetical protein
MSSISKSGLPDQSAFQDSAHVPVTTVRNPRRRISVESPTSNITGSYSTGAETAGTVLSSASAASEATSLAAAASVTSVAVSAVVGRTKRAKQKVSKPESKTLAVSVAQVNIDIVGISSGDSDNIDEAKSAKIIGGYKNVGAYNGDGEPPVHEPPAHNNVNTESVEEPHQEIEPPPYQPPINYQELEPVEALKLVPQQSITQSRSEQESDQELQAAVGNLLANTRVSMMSPGAAAAVGNAVSPTNSNSVANNSGGDGGNVVLAYSRTLLRLSH